MQTMAEPYLIDRKHFEPAHLRLYDSGELKCRVEGAGEAGRLPAVPPRLWRQPSGEQICGVQDGPLCRGEQPLRALRRGGLSSRDTRVGDNLLWLVQPALRFLPELRAELAGRRARQSPRGAGADDDSPPGTRLPQHQLCHARDVVPQILEALPPAIERGLRLPLVYNTSAYDSLDSLELMDGVIDIYMPDFKFWDLEMARRYMKAPDYPEAARRAIREMHRQVGPLVFDEDGLALRGLLIRHLVMPGEIAGTQQILEWIARELGPDTYVDLMDQYYPAGKVSGTDYVEISRRITPKEYRLALEAVRDTGLRRLDQRAPTKHFSIWQ